MRKMAMMAVMGLGLVGCQPQKQVIRVEVPAGVTAEIHLVVVGDNARPTLELGPDEFLKK